MLSVSAPPEKAHDPFARPMEWRQFFKEGDQFLHLAEKALLNPQKFSAETVYNVVAMAIEKHLMALFLFQNRLPEGHTLMNLLSFAEQSMTLDPAIFRTLAYMDSLQEICSIDASKRKEATPEELATMVAIAAKLRGTITPLLPL